MKILLWHGWLLTGSGSNVFTANVARGWRSEGHDVLILCQDGRASELPYVDRSGDFAEDNRTFAFTEGYSGSLSLGRCSVLRPDLGGLLPVFVYDAYEGFEVKRFVDLTNDELRGYVDRNVAALSTALARFEPDAVITGHEVMGPEIARQACEPLGREYVSYLHGSGLEYAVKLQERYREHSISGLNAAARVIAGSSYMLQAAATVVPGRWTEKAAVVNPGCDIELFQLADRAEPPVPSVAFVGKLIVSKGVHNFIAALGLVARDISAVIVGYGGFESELHDLAAALKERDIARALQIAVDGAGMPLAHLSAFLRPTPPGFFERMSGVPVRFTGRLEHGPLSRLLPTFDVLVVPSVLPEAFGMVAAEAAACGVLPVVPNHSGIGEAGAAIEEALGAPGMLTYDASDPVRGIAAAIERVLSIPFSERQEMGRVAADLARSRWSWPEVADQMLQLTEATRP